MGNSGGGEKWLDSETLLNIKRTADGPEMECERKRGVKVNSRATSLIK